MAEGSMSSTENPIHPEPLTDEQVGSFLAAFGNHEAKAILLASMKPGEIYTQHGLYTHMRQIQGDAPAWAMNNRTPIGYCANSLAPIGLVTKEYIDERGVWGYEITQTGIDYGVSLAGLLLDFSARHPDLSLRSLLGSTQSSSKSDSDQAKKRAPMVTLKILRELIKEGRTLRTIDVENILHTGNETIGQHLRSLKDAGVVSYESIEKDRPHGKYQLLPDHPEAEPSAHVFGVDSRGRKRAYPLLTKTIYEVCKNAPSAFTIEEVAQRVHEQPLYRKYSVKSLLNNVGKILGRLANDGYLIYEGFSHGTHSIITISPAQRAVIEDVLQLVDTFQDPVNIKRGRELARDIIQNPQLVADLLLKAKEASISAVGRDEKMPLLLKYIRENPGISNRRLQEYLLDQGVLMRLSGVGSLTRLLEKEGKIVSQMVKNNRRFSIIDG